MTWLSALFVIVAAWGGFAGGYLYARQGCQATADQLQACERLGDVLEAPSDPVPALAPFVGPPHAEQSWPQFTCASDGAGSRCCFQRHIEATFGHVSWAPLGCHREG